MNQEIKEIKKMKGNQNAISTAMKDACEKIAPLWPLENFVAVNPYMGFSNQKFNEAAAELEQVAGIRMTMPSKYYLKHMNDGKITKEDLQAALDNYGITMNADNFLSQIDPNAVDDAGIIRNPIAVVDFAAGVSETDWNRYMITRIASWIASYLDKGQSYWKATFGELSLYQSWKTEAAIDRTPDFNGLKNFRKYVALLPADPSEAVLKALEMLQVSNNEDLSLYFNRLLRIMGGWSAYLAYLDWEEKLDGKEGEHLSEFLSVLICWEACFIKCLDVEGIESSWRYNLNSISGKSSDYNSKQQLISSIILQDAYDKAMQREIIAKFKQKGNTPTAQEVKAQAIFCIDVRSEVFRRNLENINPQIETVGFAGFFGFPVNLHHLGGKKVEAQYPALIKPTIAVKEKVADENESHKAELGRETRLTIHKIWSSFKSGALTCFGFVSPLGLSYLPRIISSTFNWSRPVEQPDKYGLSRKQWQNKIVDVNTSSHDGKSTGMSLVEQIQLAKNALTAMSMTDNFGDFVLFVGHGSTSVNNPYATGLDCGACGGHSGEANAKVAATILNNKDVRGGLMECGINIPAGTTFLACLHDTTTDEIAIFNKYDVPSDKSDDLEDVVRSFNRAGQLTRTERSLKMGVDQTRDIHSQIKENGKDWSQVRPEWGLAGCSTFVIGRRSHTSHIDLQGRSFLHNYDWRKDKEFSVLEQIMTAPMVVTSWINLQYYASSVDNKNLGSGNKTLHNVTSGIGVIEGAAGDLRTGLPWQSVHNGTDFQHEPNRLNVIIEAPIEALNKVLAKHQSLSDLFDNGWIYLMALDEQGTISHLYKGHNCWENIK